MTGAKDSKVSSWSPEEERSLRVFWLPKEVCQSHEEESTACTLIAVLVVHNCHNAVVPFSPDEPSTQLFRAFRRSIDEGNSIYKNLSDGGHLKVKYMNIPEALQAVRNFTNTKVTEWDSFFYTSDMVRTLQVNMKERLQQWMKNRPHDAVDGIFSVIVLANLRAVVFVFSPDGTVTLMDSHGHCPYGAVIAMVPAPSVGTLCHWYAKQLTKDTGPISCYELSFLYCR